MTVTQAEAAATEPWASPRTGTPPPLPRRPAVEPPGPLHLVVDSNAPRNTAQVLERNEQRLNALARRGVRVIVDARDVFEFVLSQVCAGVAERDFQRMWAVDVATLLNRVEAEINVT